MLNTNALGNAQIAKGYRALANVKAQTD